MLLLGSIGGPVFITDLMGGGGEVTEQKKEIGCADKQILKFTWKCKRPKVSNHLGKKTEVMRATLPVLRAESKAKQSIQD